MNKAERYILFVLGSLMLILRLYPSINKDIYMDCLVGLTMIVLIIGVIRNK